MRKSILALMLFSSVSYSKDFCSDPHATICSQKVIKDDLGENVVGASDYRGRATVRAAQRNLVRDKFKNLFSRDDGKLLRKYAQLTGYGGYAQTKCWDWSWKSERCRLAVTEALVNSLVRSDQIQNAPRNLFEKMIADRSFRRMNKLLEDPFIAQLEFKSFEMESRFLDRPKSAAAAKLIFEEVKAAFKRKLTTWPIPQPHKNKMRERLSALKLTDRDSCSGVSFGYDPNVYNDPKENSVTICPGYYLHTNSPAAFATVLAHEIGHTIDPCIYWDANRDNGKPGDVSKIAEPYGGLVACLENRTTKGVDKVNCSSYDPISEVFADWAAAEVAPSYIESRFPTKSPQARRQRYMGALALLCGSGEMIGDPHPIARERLNNVFFQGPQVRAMASCPKPTDYCSFDSKANVRPSASGIPAKRATK